MPDTVPAAARILLDLIYRTETGRPAPECYRVIIGHRENTLPKPITDMTINELLAAQKVWGKAWKSSAAGAPQIIRKTLASLVKRLKLSGSEKFTADMQDRMAVELLQIRGWDGFIAGRNSIVQFGNALAREWASFPVLSAQQGQTRKVARGQSYYAGDGLNKALLSPGVVEQTLQHVLKAAQWPVEGQQPSSAPQPAPVPQPVPAPAPDPVVIEKPVVADPGEMETPWTRSKTVWTWALAGLGSIVTAAGNFLGGLDWRAQLVISGAIVGFAIYGIKRRRDLWQAVKTLKADLG